MPTADRMPVPFLPITLWSFNPCCLGPLNPGLTCRPLYAVALYEIGLPYPVAIWVSLN